MRDMTTSDYDLDSQVGFLLRRAYQRHTALFSQHMPDRLTPTQFAAMARLLESGPLSQNLLGREIALDGATIKGVVDRLVARGLLDVRPDPDDGRRSLVSLTDEGRARALEYTEAASAITDATLAPIEASERATLVRLLAALADGVTDDDPGAGGHRATPR